MFMFMFMFMFYVYVRSIAHTAHFVHAHVICAKAKLRAQRPVGTTIPREGGTTTAGHTKLLLHYCRTQETPGTRSTGGHVVLSRETPVGPEGTAGGSGEAPEQHQEDRREQRGDRSGPP